MVAGLILGAVIGVIAGLAAGALLGYSIRRSATRDQEAEATAAASKILGEAQAKEKEILLNAKEEAIQIRAHAEQEGKTRRDEVLKLEQRVANREENLDRKLEALERREATFTQKEQQQEVIRAEIEALRKSKLGEIERVAQMTSLEARDLLLRETEQEVREESNRLVRAIEAETKEEADRRSRSILATTMQRLMADVVTETTVSVVPIPSDDMKGRIIGREGRNIRAFELATGVDVIIDDTPDTVVVSCFDPIRRETARLALEKLVADGRIHPGRIEEVVAKSRKEIEVAIVETGEQAAYETGIHGLHPEIVKLIGRMKWRTSYGQNILQHSKEVAWLAGIMAAELGLDVAMAKRGALLHDMGKVLTHEHEGTHVQLGVEVATRYNENPLVVNCIAAHHDDVPHESEVSVLVQAADAISGSRPGARREAFETYVKRLEGLERIASSYRGVEKVYAIQAGREIRIIVTPDDVDDLRMTSLTEEIARRIEAELQYPGQIKVVVIRETRAVDFAR